MFQAEFLNQHMPVLGGGEGEVELTPNVDAILEDFKHLGEGLVTQVTRNY